MNVKDFPEEWQILFKYDKDGNIVDCVDLYELFGRNPLRYSPVFEFEKRHLQKKSIEMSPEKFETELGIIELGYEILGQKDEASPEDKSNQKKIRQAYNQVYKDIHRAKLPEYFLEEGNRQRKEGDLERAIRCYDEVIQSPKAKSGIAAQAHNNKGEVLNAKGEAKEAEKHYQAALGKDPNNLDALVNCAGALSKKGSYNDAQKHYERVLILQSNNKSALQGLIDCLGLENLRYSWDISICNKAYEESTAFEQKELDEKSMAVLDEFQGEEMRLVQELEESITKYQTQPSDPHLTKATTAAAALIKRFPQNSKAPYYLAVINLKQSEKGTLMPAENERALNGALRHINASLNLNNADGEGWRLKKTILGHLVNMNEHKISEFRERLAESPDLGEIANEEYQGNIEISAKEALIKEALEKYDSVKDFIGFVKRNALCGYLPAKDQQKIAKEHKEDPEIYTGASILTELAAGLGMGCYGFLNFDPLIMYAGIALATSSIARAASTLDSKSKVVGSPLAFWSHIKNYIAEVRIKHDKKAKQLPPGEVKLLEERAEDGFEELMDSEKNDSEVKDS